jgi:hypothetical protein
MKRIISILLLFSILTITGCSVVRSKVTVFHNLDQRATEKNFIFFPIDQQATSLEYKTYAREIDSNIAKYGYKSVSATDRYDYVIAFNYLIDQGRQSIEHVPIWGQTGVSSATTTGSFYGVGNMLNYTGNTSYEPTYGITGIVPVSKTVFTKSLHLLIFAGNSFFSPKPELLFDGTVLCEDSESSLPTVMPYMISALFEKFPGESGKTVVVESQVKQ